MSEAKVVGSAAPSGPTTAMKVGAALFAARAFVDLLWFAGSAGGEAGDVLSLVVDIGLVIGLLVGWDRAVALGIVRGVLGAGYGLLLALGFDLPGPVLGAIVGIEITGALGIVLVFVGRPPVWRLALGASIYAAHLVGAIVLFAIAPGLGSMTFETSSLDGEDLPYRLPLPSEGWVETAPPGAFDGAPAVAARHPETGAVVAVYPTLGVSSRSASLDELADQAVEALRGRFDQVLELEREPIERGMRIRVLARDGADERTLCVGVFLSFGVAYRVEASAPSGQAPSVERSLRDIVESFDPGR